MTEGRIALGAVFDQHVRHEFEDKDVEATMKTMTAEPYVWNVPTAVGGVGNHGVRRFYSEKFVGKMPDDTQLIPIARTLSEDTVVDEHLRPANQHRHTKDML